MNIHQRMIKFVTTTNWFLFVVGSILGFINTSPRFAMGIFAGALLVTLNFHFLRHTLYKALDPSRQASARSVMGVVLIKYYIRFAISGMVIFALIKGNIVDPLGLIPGLSVVVVSIIAATTLELTRLIFKEAV